LAALVATVDEPLNRAIATAFDHALSLAVVTTSAHVLALGLLDTNLLAHVRAAALAASFFAIALLDEGKARTAAVAAIRTHRLTLAAALDAGLLALAATINAGLLAAATAVGFGLLIISVLDQGRLLAATMSLVSALVGSRRGRNGQRRDTGR
jgi:hypothetical protein